MLHIINISRFKLKAATQHSRELRMEHLLGKIIQFC